jgi:DNA-binding XRE family transcriptional regulator
MPLCLVVVYLPDAERERDALPVTERNALHHATAKLEAVGPVLGHPHTSAVQGAPSLRELSTAEELHEKYMADPAYRAEHDRSRFANEVAVRVVRYRAEHGLSQSAFGRLVGMRQPHVARLESGDHEPSLSTLARLSAALGIDFTLTVTPAGVELRASA